MACLILIHIFFFLYTYEMISFIRIAIKTFRSTFTDALSHSFLSLQEFNDYMA